MMLNQDIFFSEVADVLNDEQVTISLSDPTPKEAFETLRKIGTPASPKEKIELPIKKSDENVPEDSFKKISYASVVSTFLFQSFELYYLIYSFYKFYSSLIEVVQRSSFIDPCPSAFASCSRYNKSWTPSPFQSISSQ